jgi:predicted nucleotidyltransferase
MSDRDRVLEALAREASEDADSLGLVVTGSRAAGTEDEHSDYDVVWVLTDDAFERLFPGDARARAERSFRDAPHADIVYSCPRLLAAVAAEPGWWTPGYASARVLLDKTGEVAEALRRIAERPAESASAEVFEAYDAYLNSFVRSLRAWQKGDELGARLHAAESAVYLVRALFALERRWPPYHDHLHRELGLLAAQGWEPGFLEVGVLELARGGEPAAQQRLQARVEALMSRAA